MNTQIQLTDLNNKVKEVEHLLSVLRKVAESERKHFEERSKMSAYVYEEHKIIFEPRQIKIYIKFGVDAEGKDFFLNSFTIRRKITDVVFLDLGNLFYDFAKISEEEYRALKPSKKAKLIAQFFNHYYTEPFVQLLKIISMRFWNPVYHKAVHVATGSYYRNGKERMYSYNMFTGKRVSHKS